MFSPVILFLSFFIRIYCEKGPDKRTFYCFAFSVVWSFGVVYMSCTFAVLGLLLVELRNIIGQLVSCRNARALG